MSGELPEIYWYLLWVGVLAFVAVFAFATMAAIHRRNMRAFALLTLYADKGLAPPAGLAELFAAAGREPARRGASAAADRAAA